MIFISGLDLDQIREIQARLKECGIYSFLGRWGASLYDLAIHADPGVIRAKYPDLKDRVNPVEQTFPAEFTVGVK